MRRKGSWSLWSRDRPRPYGMKVFAIGDLHLSGAVNKPMDLFGKNWEHHDARIAVAWRERVGEDDLVLLPGDFSWAMKKEEAAVDFAWLAALPGKKVMIRGNHDYWWNSLAQVRAMLPPNTYVIQNDCCSFGDVHVAGTRGWACPGSAGFTQEDEKLYLREVNRLRLSLERLPRDGFRIVMLHYPPLNEKREESGFTEQLRDAKVDFVVYGHLHGRSCRYAFEGRRDDVEYRLVSADHLGFSPLAIPNL